MQGLLLHPRAFAKATTSEDTFCIESNETNEINEDNELSDAKNDKTQATHNPNSFKSPVIETPALPHTNNATHKTGRNHQSKKTRATNTKLASETQTQQPLVASKDIIGYWLTEDKDGVVEFYPCQNFICGKLHWIKLNDPNEVSRDSHNPDPTKQGRPLCGLEFIGGFQPSPENPNILENGWIYSPRHGAMFSATLKMIDKETLDLHGYMLTPLLGQSQIWHRTNADPACKIPK